MNKNKRKYKCEYKNMYKEIISISFLFFIINTIFNSYKNIFVPIRTASFLLFRWIKKLSRFFLFIFFASSANRLLRNFNASRMSRIAKHHNSLIPKIQKGSWKKDDESLLRRTRLVKNERQRHPCRDFHIHN